MDRRRVATAATAAAADGGLADRAVTGRLTDRELGLQRGGTATGAAQRQHGDTTMSQLITVGGGQRRRRVNGGRARVAGGSSVRN